MSNGNAKVFINGRELKKEGSVKAKSKNLGIFLLSCLPTLEKWTTRTFLTAVIFFIAFHVVQYFETYGFSLYRQNMEVLLDTVESSYGIPVRDLFKQISTSMIKM